jgi:hypothetical protein
VIAADLEKPAEEGGGAPHLVLGVEPLEIEHGGDTMDPRSLAGDSGLRSVCSSASITRWPKRSVSDTKSPSGSMMVCCTQRALCSSSRRSRWGLNHAHEMLRDVIFRIGRSVPSPSTAALATCPASTGPSGVFYNATPSDVRQAARRAR